MSCLLFSLLFLGAKLSPCGIHEARATPSAGSSRTWQVKQAKLARHKDAAGIGFIVVAIVFVLRQDVLLCGGGRSTQERGQLADKNYYRPNKRYFSRDECALVRVLFYFVELQPAS